MDFKHFYSKLRSQRIESSFIKQSIASHCGVSIHLVQKWLSGTTIRPPYIKLMSSFDINEFKKGL